jgi:hypothetical protein
MFLTHDAKIHQTSELYCIAGPTIRTHENYCNKCILVTDFFVLQAYASLPVSGVDSARM